MPTIGTISPPGWVSFCGAELKQMANAPLEVIDLPMPVDPGFAFGTRDILNASSAIEAAAWALAEQGVDAILQIGGPFAVLHGMEDAKAMQQRISDRISLPFDMMALSMFDALERVEARRVMMCSAYYPEDWAARYEVFLSSGGKVVCGRQSFSELGVAPAQNPSMMAKTFEEIGPDAVVEALTRCAAIQPEAAVYLAGVPCPLLAHHAALQSVTSLPVITYLDSYICSLERIGLEVKPAFRV